MSWFGDTKKGFKAIKDRGKQIDDAVGNDEGHDENHEPRTPRGEARGCYKIDPVTKQPACDDE